MSRLFHEVFRIADKMGAQEWLFALVAVVIVGLISMRGFGSRSKY